MNILIQGDKSLFEPYIDGFDELNVEYRDYDVDALLDQSEEEFDRVICVDPLGLDDMSDAELSQVFTAHYPKNEVYFFSSTLLEQSRITEIIKNGIHNVISIEQPVESVKRLVFGPLMKSSEEQDHIVIIGQKSDFSEILPAHIDADKCHEIPYDDEKMEEPINYEPAAVLVMPPDAGAEGSDLSLDEVGQILMTVYPESPRILMTKDAKVDFEGLEKNGFTDVYSLEHDLGLANKRVSDAVAISQGRPVFNRISLLDLKTDIRFDFDIYLKMGSRDKYLKYLKKGYPLEEKRLAKLQNFNGQTYVPAHQLQDFYKYCADYLKEASATQTQEEVRKKTRKLYSSILSKAKSFQDGDQALDQVKGLVGALLPKQAQMSKKVKSLIDFSDLYVFASNVSGMAAAMSMVSGVGDPEEIATAALLMDMGQMMLPKEVREKSVEEMTFEELDQYKTHPELSLQVLNEKKMRISDSVRKLIREHHEQFNGKGFPKGLSGTKISAESSLLCLADIIVTKMKTSKSSPKELIQTIHKEMAADFELMKVEPKFAKKFVSLFDAEEKQDAATAEAS